MTIKDNKIKIIQMMSLVNDNPLKSHTNIHASEIKIFKNHIYASNRSENNIIIYNCRSTLSTYDKMMKDVNELTMKEWLDNWWTCIH